MTENQSSKSTAWTASLEFVSIGCNRVSGCASWGRNNLVAYSAGNFVSLYSPQAFKVIGTVPGHGGRVNTVKWIPNIKYDYKERVVKPEEEILSGSSDTTLISWKQVQGEWVQTGVLKGHKDSVTSTDCISFPDGALLAASASADSTVNIWRRKAPESRADFDPSKLEWTLSQTISFAPKMMDCVALTILPQTGTPLMACAGVDTMVHLFIEVNGTFHKLAALQGHMDWIRSLAFTIDDSGDTLLASSSQDTKVRLWKIAPESSVAATSLLSSLNNSSSNKATAISSKGHIFKVNDVKYIALLESVLAAHEEWVYSVSWQPQVLTPEGKLHQPMALLSASMDKTMMIWRPSKSSTIWINEVRVGELGGNTLGFFGGVFSPDGKSILAHGYNGAFHLWRNTSETADQEMWTPQVTVSGHFGPVMDITWDPTYQYFVSVSEDQTTRLFSTWMQRDNITTWHEISRVQIHGYDMTCLSFVNNASNRLISGAEEKVLRVFDAPQTTIASIQTISQIKLPELAKDQRPLGANVPPLGLSNKPVFTESDMAQDSRFEEYEAPAPMPTAHIHPPFEEHLLQSTLWPEIHKLYGHPNELVAVTCNYSGTLAASACKGTKADQSSIRIWNTSTWKPVELLTAHTLTVVQLEFSHDDKHLLSVSRDRQFCIFDIEGEEGKETFKLVLKNKAHERIIWSGSWSFDDKLVATGSRDKTVKIWTQADNKWGNVSTLSGFEKGVTAVAWGLTSQKTGGYSLAVGLENGKISLWMSNNKVTEWTCMININPFISHVDTVRRLRFKIDPKQPKKSVEDNSSVQLATCSTDNSVRLFTITYN